MRTSFDLNGRLVVVPVVLAGPEGAASFQFALDTGATHCSASGLVLGQLGYRESQATGRHRVRTGSGSTLASRLRVTRVGALGHMRTDFPVFWLPLPPATMIDGLLGLDFFRGLVLTIDFAQGTIDLDPPRRPRPRWRVWG